MAVTIYAWIYGLKNSNQMLLNKTNPGHTSIEISGTRKEISKIYKDLSLKYPAYLSAHNDVQNFINLYNIKFSNQNDSIIFKKARKNIIKDAVQIYLNNELEGKKFAKKNNIKDSTLDSALFINDFKKTLFEKIPSSTIKFPNGEFLTSIYLSFFPNPDEKINITNFDKKSNNLYNNLKNKKNYQNTEILASTLNTYKEDCIEEEIGIDIDQIFKDITPENLEEIKDSRIQRLSSSTESLDKKDKIFFKIRSGKLKGVKISQLSYAQFSNYYKFIRNRRSITYRYNLLNPRLEVDNSLIKAFLTEYQFKNPFESLVSDLSYHKKNLEIYIEQFNENILHHKKIILKINEKINSIEQLIIDLNTEFNYTQKIYNDYIFLKGLPPSDIITFPSKICDNYGIDEVLIIKNWLDKVSTRGYNLETTNCSWAVFNAFTPSAKEFVSKPYNFRIRPLTPLDIVSYSKKVQDVILKKFELNSINKFQVPNKILFKSHEFKSLTANSFLQTVSFHKSANIDSIYLLLEKYDRVGDHQINIRIFLLERLLVEVNIWLDQRIDLICKNRSNKSKYIKILLNRIASEKERLINYLFKIKNLDELKNRSNAILKNIYNY